MKAPAKKETRTIEELRQLTVRETAALLGYSRGTIDNMINSGELTAVGETRRKRVPLWAIEDWQRKNSSGG